MGSALPWELKYVRVNLGILNYLLKLKYLFVIYNYFLIQKFNFKYINIALFSNLLIFWMI